MRFLGTILDTFGAQTFEAGDLATVGLLVLLEGVLSIDNALVLGLLARRLPDDQRRKALTYGLVGAFVFRAAAIFAAAWLLRSRFVKLLGGAYLLYLCAKNLVFKKPQMNGPPARAGGGTGEAALAGAHPRRTFWRTVVAIELTDVAFAVDSILAAIALVSEDGPPAGPTAGPSVHPKLWVVVAGGFLGVVLVRVAAALFIRLIERFPRFETAAYLLVFVIGCKLLLDWAVNTHAHPHRLSFHDFHTPAPWVFWALMAAGFVFGFLPRRRGRGEEGRAAEPLPLRATAARATRADRGG